MWKISVVLMLLLAGCAGAPVDEDQPIQTIDVEPPADGTGSISGVVVNELLIPVEAAFVELSTGENTTTNEEGQFVFEALEPGIYFVEASADNHEGAQTSVDIVAGEVSKPRIQMLSVPIQEPYHSTYKRDLANVASVPVLVVYYSGERVELDGPFETLVVDGAWGGNLFVAIDPEKAIQTSITSDPSGWSETYQTPAEFSIRVDRNETMPEEMIGLNWYSRPNFDSISVQAEGEMFFTSFYHGEAPDGWSLHNGDS